MSAVSRVDLLRQEMAEVYDRLCLRLDGLSQDEYFWEPVPGCWTIHPDDRGVWVADYDEPDPVPPPFTTIGWRLVHLADCKVMYHEWAFGPRRLTFSDLPGPTSVAEAVLRLREGHALLHADLGALDEADLDTPRLTNWGEEWPTWRIFWTMIDHDAHHGGEIGCLRDLYRETGVGR